MKNDIEKLDNVYNILLENGDDIFELNQWYKTEKEKIINEGKNMNEKRLQEILKELANAIVYFDSIDDFGTSDRIFELINDLKDKYGIDD